jgi:Arc/MetJ family transcription regulator
MTKMIDIEVEEEVLKAAMRRAGTSEPKEAMIEALKEYTRPQGQKDLIKLLGTSDTFMTPEELEQMRSED